VRGVLEKTGCRRQLDVVALLAGIVPPPNSGLDLATGNLEMADCARIINLDEAGGAVEWHERL
jgi:hypothetical protein